MKQKIHIIVTELFEASLIFYLILMLAETMKTGFVSSVINPGYLLIPLVLSAVIMVLTEDSGAAGQPEKMRLRESDVYFLLFSGTVSGGLVFYKTMQYGWISYAVAGAVFLCVSLLTYLVLSE